MSQIIFKNAFLIDGNGGDPLEDAVVTVSNGKIKSIEAGSAGIPMVEGKVIDLHGKTLMPGLSDAHVHAGNIALDFDQTAKLSPAVYVHRATRNLETAVNLGFTTVRDAGGLDGSFRDAINQGLINGPRLLLSVSMLSQTGGHGDKRGAWRDAHVPRNSLGLLPMICDGPDSVRKAGREVLRKGADQIKVMASGGVASPSDKTDQWQFTVDELKAAVETAKAAGTYVMAHAYGAAAIRNCIDAGIRSIEHGNLLDAQIADLMAEKGVFYVPTLSVYEVLTSKELGIELDPFVRQKLDEVAEVALNALELAYRAGVKIGSGSDIIGPFQHLKGRELSIKANVMTAMEAIVSATRTNAELFNMSDRIGTVEAGKSADMIVLDGNPLDDLSLFNKGEERVVLVMKEGSIMKNFL